MASSLPNSNYVGYKEYRRLLKKKRRKLKRRHMALVEERTNRLHSNDCQHMELLHESEKQLLEEHLERERRREHYLWLKRDAAAHEEFKKRSLQAEKIQKQKDEELQLILNDFEKLRQQNLEKEQKEDTLKEIIHNLPLGDEPWHNPIVPPQVAPSITPVAKQEKCQFFSKTGACRFGERCSRHHDKPPLSRTLLIRNLYNHLSIETVTSHEYDTDVGLEYDEAEMKEHFEQFYADVLPEFKKIGRVEQFKVCCNQEHHLRGNVYVQFKSEDSAAKAMRVFNGRWYGGKQASCEFSCVHKWRPAICGMFLGGRCPKGRTCNFLHVFRNPGGEFREADRDYEPDKNRRNYGRDDSAHFYRRTNHRRRSRSPDRRSSTSRSSSSYKRRSLSPKSSHAHKSRSPSPKSSHAHKTSSYSKSPTPKRRSSAHYRKRSRNSSSLSSDEEQWVEKT